MLRRLFIGQAILVTSVVAALTATHFVLNAVHPEAADVIFMVGLAVALALLLASVAIIGRGISRVVGDLEASHMGTVTSLAAAIDASDDSEHEHWDGSGYPAGLMGDRIPLFARIVLACDAYHAMTSDRPYRSALPEDEARRRLREDAGRQFDPAVVHALLASLPPIHGAPEPVRGTVSA